MLLLKACFWKCALKVLYVPVLRLSMAAIWKDSVEKTNFQDGGNNYENKQNYLYACYCSSCSSL